jgi:hypothetical protein
MKNFEILTLIISVLALAVSFVTAYRTWFPKFKGEVFIRPYVVLTRLRGSPSIVMGFEITNTGNRSGLLNDLLLIMNYQQSNSRNKYSFFPVLIRQKYSVFETYEESDFEPFQAISVSANERLTRYIMFLPSQAGFSPAAGDIEVNVFVRKREGEFESAGKTRFTISSDEATIWQNPDGESIMKETAENNRYRETLMDREFR